MHSMQYLGVFSIQNFLKRQNLVHYIFRVGGCQYGSLQFTITFFTIQGGWEEESNSFSLFIFFWKASLGNI